VAVHVTDIKTDKLAQVLIFAETVYKVICAEWRADHIRCHVSALLAPVGCIRVPLAAMT